GAHEGGGAEARAGRDDAAAEAARPAARRAQARPEVGRDEVRQDRDAARALEGRSDAAREGGRRARDAEAGRPQVEEDRDARHAARRSEALAQERRDAGREDGDDLGALQGGGAPPREGSRRRPRGRAAQGRRHEVQEDRGPPDAALRARAAVPRREDRDDLRSLEGGSAQDRARGSRRREGAAPRTQVRRDAGREDGDDLRALEG